MNFFDYTLITIIGLSMVLSLWRGFVREIISLVGLVLAFFLASRFAGDASGLFDQWISQNNIANIAAFVLIFVLVMFSVGMVGFIVRKLVDLAALTATDRTLGMFFGAARGFLLIGTAFLMYTAYAKPDQPWMQKSVLTPYAIQLSEFIGKTIPSDYPFSTQEGGSAPEIPSAGDVIQKAKDQITPEDKEAMKDLLLDTLKETKP
ncbi:MAG TPA: CvpA family protein [Ghiorsea sp.]|nr:CvpA family protein [Ghiorsea sp.]HIP07101.1 CvpA family protein [Mariprofundaceae bacterium]